jgi:L-glyceraldehyde 3-phosphate reductase
MRYRSIPAIGVSLSEIGFGCGGTAGLMVRGPHREQLTVIAHAVDQGINYFDVAPDYGRGTAEENLGRVLRELEAKPYITTKVEIRADDLDDIAGHVVRSSEASLRRLGVDCVDVLQIHNAPVMGHPHQPEGSYAHLGLDHYLGPHGALEGVQRAQRAGNTRHVGFIVRGGDVDAVSQVLNTQAFQLINVSYHLLNPTAGQPAPPGMRADPDWGQVIDDANALGIGVAVYSPLANGLLTDGVLRGAAAHHLSGSRLPERADYPEMVRKAQSLSFLSVPGVQSLSEASYRFILMHPGVTSVVGGFSELSHLDEALTAATRGALAQPDLARLDAVWRASFAT